MPDTGGVALSFLHLGATALPVWVGSGLSIGVFAFPEMMAVETSIEVISGGRSWRDQLRQSSIPIGGSGIVPNTFAMGDACLRSKASCRESNTIGEQAVRHSFG